MVTDPTTAAREWLAANPEHEVAVHVRAALDSADRYERLALTMEEAKPGTLVVLTTTDVSGQITFTSPSRVTEQRVAELCSEYWKTIRDVGFIETIRARLQKRAAALAGRMAKKKVGTPQEAHARGALEEVTLLRKWVES